MSKLVVVGSSNTDLVIQAAYFPRPGETVIGNNFKVNPGGKGANQAVAASRLGGEVCLIARVGNDNYGFDAIKGFSRENIQTDYIVNDYDCPSGVALITVNKQGQNTIVVHPGANSQLSVEDIDNAIDVIRNSSIILIQLEIPIAVVKYVLDLAVRFGKRVILNPAPAIDLENDILEKIYLITPNETEASLLTGCIVNDLESASKAADILLSAKVKNVIITLGKKGAYFKNSLQEFHIPACKTNVTDTTAAGDVFNGAIAVALIENMNWEKAVAFANTAASIAVTRFGAQSSAPYRNEINSQNY